MSRSRTQRKEAFFVQVAADDGTPQFFNVSTHLGKPMPFNKPQATCAMRAADDTVAFSLLLLTNRAASNIAETPMSIPKGPLARLERKARSVEDLDTGTLVIEFDDKTHNFKIERDDNGVATISEPDDATEPIVFELPRGGPKVTMYLRSPAVERTIAVSCIGGRYPGKPGTPETLVRCVSMVLFNLSQLVEFRLLSGIETVDVPPAPSRWAATAPTRDADDEVVFDVPVYLFSSDETPMPVGAGTVSVRVDLDNANPSGGGQLLYHLTPDEKIAEVFEPFRGVVKLSITHFLRLHLGDEDLTNIAVDVVLGTIDSRAVERLRDAAAPLADGLDLTPQQYRLHDVVPAKA